MLVRLAEEHDIETIADVYIASYGGLTFLPRLHSDAETRDWVRMVMAPRNEVWVAELAGRWSDSRRFRTTCSAGSTFIRTLRIVASGAPSSIERR